MKHTYYIISLVLITYLLVACATQAPIVVEEKAPAAPVIEVVKSNTDCTTLLDIDPAIRSDTEDAFTLYKDEIRYKKYEAALLLWKTAYYTAPGANGKMTSHFDDGVKIYDYLFKKEIDENKKAALVDTILSIYDKRLECFEDDGTIIARKAFNSYYSYSQYTDSDETFELFKEVIKRKGLKTDYFVVNPFSKLLYDRVLENKIDHQEASVLALQIFDIVEEGLAKCKGEYCDAWAVIDAYAPPLLSGLEGIKGFYPCEYFMENYYTQFEEDPTNCDNITEVYLKMVWGGCDQEDERLKNLKAAKEKECYVAPPPPGPLTLAYQALERGEFRESIKMFEDYTTTSDDPEKKAKYLFLISKIYYAHIKNFPAARKYALSAAANKSNWGEPYMLIGKLYASSGPLCGPGTGWDSQVVTWVAIDKFNYAKKIDPAVTADANKWINRYSQYMPKKEDIFFRQLKAGSSFKVPCWIQETTKVRTSD